MQICFATPDDRDALLRLWPAVSETRAIVVDSVESAARMLESETGLFFTLHTLFRGSPPRAYDRVRMHLVLLRGEQVRPSDTIERLIELGYRHDPSTGEPGTYRQDGDTLHVWGYGERAIASVGYFGDEIDDILSRDPFTGVVRPVPRAIFARSPELPATAFDILSLGDLDLDAWREACSEDTFVCFDPEFLPAFADIRSMFAKWYALAESSVEPAVANIVGIRPVAYDSLDALANALRERP